jgi:endonuclease/exonuclease/phosphatase family metal-dependent hydrolase
VQWRLADLNPDLLASSDGGSNQILVRRPGRIAQTRRMRLAERPERRRMIWARVELPEGRVCVANLHASAGLQTAAAEELVRAAGQALEWSAGHPLVLGGDFNVRPRHDPAVFAALNERFGLGEPTAPAGIDHLLARGLEVEERPHRLDARERELAGPGGRLIRLSDHAPVAARFGLP